jgi:hypothetical protein
MLQIPLGQRVNGMFCLVKDPEGLVAQGSQELRGTSARDLLLASNCAN